MDIEHILSAALILVATSNLYCVIRLILLKRDIDTQENRYFDRILPGLADHEDRLQRLHSRLIASQTRLLDHAKLFVEINRWRSQAVWANPDHVHHMGGGRYTSTAGAGDPTGTPEMHQAGVAFTHAVFSGISDATIPQSNGEEA